MTDHTDDQPNEIVAAAAAMKAQAEAAAGNAAGAIADKTRNWPLAKIGLGVGIGSAAISAAVLFANRRKK